MGYQSVQDNHKLENEEIVPVPISFSFYWSQRVPHDM